MNALSDIQALITAAKTANTKALVKLRGLYLPGSAIEFKYGNMADIHNATVIRVCAFDWLGVVIRNEDTKVERKIPVSAIVPPHPRAETQPPVYPALPMCGLCEDGLAPWENRMDCPCGNVLVRSENYEKRK